MSYIRWSGLARLIFSLLLVGNFLLVSQFAALQPWVWMVLLTVPLVGWFFDDELRHAQLQVAAMVQSTADTLRLEKYQAGEEAAGALRQEPNPAAG